MDSLVNGVSYYKYITLALNIRKLAFSVQLSYSHVKIFIIYFPNPYNSYVDKRFEKKTIFHLNTYQL
jgi:hypothetical protein